MIHECLTDEGFPRLEKQQEYVKLIDDYIGDLQAKRLAPMTVADYVKGVKAFFRANNVHLNLPFKMIRRVKYRDRSPTPEELVKIIDIGDLREKAIISTLALSGVRVGTLQIKIQACYERS
jgi:integrase